MTKEIEFLAKCCEKEKMKIRITPLIARNLNISLRVASEYFSGYVRIGILIRQNGVYKVNPKFLKGKKYV